MATASKTPPQTGLFARSRREVGPRAASLAGVPAGKTVRIGSVEGESGVAFRLLELGFTPGQEVTPIAAAPFGGPVAVALRGTIVALRSAEAACIRV
ncbi:MAG: ferrous iron transport protein A [Candidatus Sericytochromatia bacterium]|nr:ferrous iron transport protein A [Candidatus Tanganyikabacteria bacterium]